jgi:hypothetical protein
MREAEPQAYPTGSSRLKGQIKTGQHYDAGFLDDLVNGDSCCHPILLDKVEEDFNMARPLVDPGCPRFGLDQQPQGSSSRSTGWGISLRNSAP